MNQLTGKNGRVSAIELPIGEAARQVDLVLGRDLDPREVVGQRAAVERHLLDDLAIYGGKKFYHH